MYPITEAVKALFEAEHRKVLRITGTDKNGASIIITDDNVMEDSFQIDRYSCNGEKLEIGTAIAAQLTFTLENGDGAYDGIAFEGTELFVEVGVADWTQASPTIHWVPCGYFTPDEQPRRLSTISITALDRMMRFDVVPPTLVPWTTANGEVMTTRSGEPIYFLKSIRFPCTIAQMAQQMAAICNVPFTQDLSGFPNYNVTIQELPVTLESITYRMILQWCAGIMGANAWIDWTGSLRFSWYTNATGYISTIDNRYSSDLYENDLTITGVSYTNSSGVEFVEGTDAYALDIVGNYMIGGQVATLLPVIASTLNGFTYRPFTAAVVNAPYLWPMDVITFTDKDGNSHTSALTNVAFGLNGTTALESKGMTYAINRGKRPSGLTKQQAQLVNEVRESVVKLDDSLTQQEIFNRLTDNGAAQGLVMYNGQLYVNASYIQSGTLTLGGVNNQNGVLNVVDASGNSIGSWTKDGIVATLGYIGNWQILSDAIQLSRDVTSTRRVLAYLGHAGFMYRYLNNGANYLRTILIDDRITLTDDVLGLGARLAVEPNSDSDGVDLIIQTSSAGGETPEEWTNALVIGRDRTRAGCFESDSFIVPDANGNVVGQWTKDGISANSGKIGGISFGSGNYGGLQYSYSGILAYLGPSGVIYRKLVSGDYRSVTIDPDIDISIGDAHVRLSIHEDTGDNDVELKVQTSLDGGVTWTDALLVGNNTISAPGMASGTFATADGKTVTVENGFITDIS